MYIYIYDILNNNLIKILLIMNFIYNYYYFCKYIFSLNNTDYYYILESD